MAGANTKSKYRAGVFCHVYHAQRCEKNWQTQAHVQISRRRCLERSWLLSLSQVLLSIIRLWSRICAAPTCPVQLCPAPFPSQTQTSPRDFGTPINAHQTSLIQNLNFTAWILRKLDQESAGEAAVFNSLYLPNFTAEIKYPYVMAQSFLAQWSMRYISIQGNQ